MAILTLETFYRYQPYLARFDLRSRDDPEEKEAADAGGAKKPEGAPEEKKPEAHGPPEKKAEGAPEQKDPGGSTPPATKPEGGTPPPAKPGG
jgi:hypothetical protein